MDQSNLTEDISKQLDMGFSHDEIKANLLAKGYDEASIQNGLDGHTATIIREKKPVNYWQLLISVAFVIVGIYDINNKAGFSHTWGYVLVVIGIIGFLLKLFLPYGPQKP